MEKLPSLPFLVRTLYAKGDSDDRSDDLAFHENELIKVTSFGDGNWWKGTMVRNKTSGHFPRNYVELVEDNTRKTTQSSSKVQVSKQRSQSPEEENMNFSFQDSRAHYREETSDPYAPPGPYSSSSVSHSDSHRHLEGKTPQRSGRQSRPQDRYSHDDNLHRVSLQSPSINKSDLPPLPMHNDKQTSLSPHHFTHLNQQQQQQQQPYRQKGSQRPEICNSNNNSRSSLNRPQLPNVPSNVNTTLHFSTYPSPPLSHLPSTAAAAPQQSNILTIPYTADSLGQNDNLNGGTNSLGNFTYSQGTYFQNPLNSSSSSSVMFGMSDFSATSAGSFSRHRYEEQLRLSQMNNSASGNNLLVDERRVKNGRGFMKRFFGGGRGESSSTVPALPFTTLTHENNNNNNNQEMELWLRSRAELHRSATLSKNDRRARERRIRETESEVILEPHKGISKFNENEMVLGLEDRILDLDSIDFQDVELSMEKFWDWKSFHSNAQNGPEGIIRGLGRFKTRIEYVRAIFKFCISYFDVYIDSPIVSTEEDLNYTREEIIKYIQQRKIDSLALAKMVKSLIDLLKMTCEIIPGVMKLPTVPVRHYWNSILINGQWRMIDVWISNIHNPQSREFISDYYTNGQNYTDFYFLNKPLNFIHTHIPLNYEYQHINPPINDRIAHQLPPCFPAFFQNGLEISRFNNSLTRLQDTEMFELDLKIPNDIELNTTVLTPRGVYDSNSLCQIYWFHGQRYAKVKGCLPIETSTGFINISVGIKGIQLTPVNPHALAMVIPITHSGKSSQFLFLTRIPHNSTSSTNDLYVKQPQNRVLVYGTDYIFNILSHANGEQSARFVVAIETPSSRVIRLDAASGQDGYINWTKTLRCDEVGVWRGLVSVDQGSSGLCVFAEWSCER